MEPTVLPFREYPSVGERHSLRALASILTGGPTQSSANAIALELALAAQAKLTGVTPEDPSAPIRNTLKDMIEGTDPTLRSSAYQWAIDDLQAQRRRGDGADFQIVHAGHPASLHTVLAAQDLAVAPAGMNVAGATESVTEEVAALVAKSDVVPVLRVSRRPLSVKNLLFVVGSTGRCCKLAQRYIRTGLWPQASLSFLPIGRERKAVLLTVDAQVELLRSHGRRATVLPALELGFEEPELLRFADGFPVTIMGQLSHRIGYLGQVRNDPFEIVSRMCPMVLLP